MRETNVDEIIAVLKQKCEQLEEEKGLSMLELQQTQLMSNDQLQRLMNLESKQDLLENNSMQMKDELLHWEENLSVG